MTLSILLLTSLLTQYQGPGRGNTNEDQVQACIASCQATIDKPGWELRACIEKCLELGRP